MELYIKENDAYRRSMRIKELLWNLYFRKIMKASLIQIALGIFLLIIGFSHGSDSGNTTDQPYPNIFVGQFGIAYLLIILGRLFTTAR